MSFLPDPKPGDVAFAWAISLTTLAASIVVWGGLAVYAISEILP